MLWTISSSFTLRRGTGIITRSGFTLFEVALSLAIVTFGVVSVLMILPSGLRAQQNARLQIHSCVVMQKIARVMVEPGLHTTNLQVESELLSNNQYMRRASPDLETIAASTGLGLCPIPTDIARRIDSDNDEIVRVINAGGHIYYSAPGLGVPQNLIIGFVGTPQLNAIPNHPCLAWPYWDNHPMAPAKWERDSWLINGAPMAEGGDPSVPLPERWGAWAEFDALYRVFNTQNDPQANMDYTKWTQYLEAAKALVIALNIPLDPGNVNFPPPEKGPIPRKPQPLPATGHFDLLPPEDRDPRPEHIWAISHLAHAAGMATATLTGKPTNFPEPDDIKYAQATYEACVEWIRRVNVINPYNWGVARHISTMTAWCHPLLQHDVIDTSFFTDSSTGDRAWRIVAPQRVTMHGRARGVYGNTTNTFNGIHRYLPPNHTHIRGGWGDPSHFVLTRSFHASERIRQVVFWGVDWQSCNDFEKLPAPAHDATTAFRDSLGTHVQADWWGATMPERSLYWNSAAQNVRAGDIRGVRGGAHGVNGQTNQVFDPWTDTAEYKAGYFMGIYGADRNGNGRLDEGAVPSSVRLRATTIARFPIYDRILIGDGRH